MCVILGNLLDVNIQLEDEENYFKIYILIENKYGTCKKLAKPSKVEFIEITKLHDLNQFPQVQYTKKKL